MLRFLLPLCATVPLAALDLVESCDLRANAGWAGGRAEIGGGPAQVRTDLEGWRGGADLVAGIDLVPVGVVAGAGFTSDQRSGSGWDRDTIAGRVLAGPFLAVGPVTLELTGAIGLGQSRTTAPSGQEIDAPVREWSADATLTVGLGPLRVGAQGGWLDSRSEAAGDWRGTTSVHAEGWHTAAVLGWSF